MDVYYGGESGGLPEDGGSIRWKGVFGTYIGMYNSPLDAADTFTGIGDGDRQMKRRVSMRRSLIVLCAVVLIAGLASGCATSNAIQSARAQLQAAKGAGADWSAPFEYYAGEYYLKKAVLEAEEGDGKAANVFTKQSSDYSAKALETAKGGAK
jgi:hypothetical protein